MNRNPWVENLFRPLAIGGMIACIVLAIVDLARLFVPDWSGTYLVIGSVLTALEANYSYRLIRARRLRGADVLRFRGVELAMLFILLKIGSYVGNSWSRVLADIQTWLRQPQSLFAFENFLAFGLVFLSWRVSTQTIKDLERLNEPPEQNRRYVPPLETLTERFFWGGMALLIVAGITRIGIAALLNLSHPPVPGIVLNVLIYFLLGLVMLGHIHFTRLYRQWQTAGIQVAEGLAGRWIRYSLAFIGLATLAAFLLPTGYTVSLLDTASIILSTLIYVVALLFQIIMLAITLLLTPLMMLFGNKTISLPPLDVPSYAPLQESNSAAALGWFEILKSLLSWIVMLGMVSYVVRSYLHDHPELPEAVTTLKAFRALRNFLLALWRRLVGLAEAVNERIPRGLPLPLRRMRSKSAEAGFRFFRLGALSPRERVLYYYLSILRRAGRQGFPRYRSQTPHEYDAALEPHLPEAQQEMTLLTQAFVEARYSQHAVNRQQEKRVRADWQQVKAALRALQQTSNADELSNTEEKQAKS
jgi:hypothetical protein